MTELEVAQAKLHDAEARLRDKEHDWFVIRFVVTPSVLALIGALVTVCVVLIKAL